ncbi:auxin-induced protein 22B-like [Magnolia sinica]|uniref:auxin-induced protein 22B-like n=1 Tax=Magnolia sinica TaxID=86752 RepID=UPI0026585F9A|nr:auxin-induced protein 22B-like [Magnolia sinica]
MESATTFEADLTLKATELRLGLPGTDSFETQTPSISRGNKRTLAETMAEECRAKTNPMEANDGESDQEAAPVAKAQVVGWPPIRSYRKNSFQARKTEAETAGIYVKVSMDGAPYLRKIDLKVYNGYPELLKALETMFKCFITGEFSEREGYKGTEYEPTYEDKDGDWMLVGDVPWDMFISSCKRLRIMKGSEARGLGSCV